ncbi:hypothetical protein JTB14_000668 [Gonioctena quinquepunctata]|nr:hypothetical protein JTB14_000668 [Gonioctena quinquepunctata]
MKRKPPITEESKELVQIFEGPYAVTEKLPQDRYRIEDLPEIQRTSRFYKGIASVDSMKRCNIQISQNDDGKSSNGESHDGEPTKKRVRKERRKPIRYQDFVLFVDEK